ncbi:hypothetical protein [Proteus terrae]|uniref:hypothetical protein n=1 Tax=Proteus terrae TaxID=1574161 RepID=UPI00301CAB70
MNDKYKAELINGKPVILLNGNMIEKGFISIVDAQAKADKLNQSSIKKQPSRINLNNHANNRICITHANTRFCTYIGNQNDIFKFVQRNICWTISAVSRWN